MDKRIYRVMILDDALESTVVLQLLLKRIEEIEVVHCCGDGKEALKILEVEPVDILFLDMDMPEMMGWEFAKLLNPRPVVIVSSAYGGFGYQAHEVGSVGYISKIPDWELLKSTVGDAIRAVEYRESLLLNNSTSFQIRNFTTKRLQVIKHEDFVYASIDDKDSTIYLVGGETVISQISLKDLMKKLPKDKFVRIGSKEIIYRYGISGYKSKTVTMKISDGHEVSLKVPAQYAHEIIGNWLADIP
ncbi:LytR/AlgR family response regulator transcription factor [Sphingobacterium suaedae]|uniref:LytR/AlgR family response regulator transcription factor n=1 Tax=Sphingobacterium suaedae TaxID=1686402 RepID=A0ABW5KNA6_9SPHI